MGAYATCMYNLYQHLECGCVLRSSHVHMPVTAEMDTGEATQQDKAISAIWVSLGAMCDSPY